ncbi:DeoR/GlpR family DNA-binding transcription regulator [Olivibacter domesticus]|uniref:Transcriptional regulator, DeoR family n=1 Tax=Olivibacter domesticus TaxID=407022 RepID=A0A1H7I141_OLID1|nr:DeoR/GlpR family DNA-binding transcription regulator [Olivibacter domesticus]SEK56251.1 transcriptional regulator, DeoR family [Olivibacter domesticus]
MIKAERQQLLTKHIANKQSAQLKELSELLNVSEDTVRRDIKELADLGIIKAVRGGAIAHSPVPHHYRERENLQVTQKEIIAQKAVRFVEDGQVVFFDGGTSTLAVAAALRKDIQITVVTNSFPVVNILEDYPSAEVIFIGGRLNKKAFTTFGSETIDAIRTIKADISFLGICSIDLEYGITTRDYEDCIIKKNIVANAKRVIALSTINKVGTAEPFVVCSVNAIDVILTDDAIDEKTAALFEEQGVLIQ